jgi:hypothetical protein
VSQKKSDAKRKEKWFVPVLVPAQFGFVVVVVDCVCDDDNIDVAVVDTVLRSTEDAKVVF